MTLTYRHRVLRQRGFALMLVLLLIGVGVGAALFSFFNPNTIALENDQKTTDVLAIAKEALIGRAVSDDNRPGSLPCPDALTNIAGNVPNDGIADLFTGNECPSYIGRLPWRTLGLPDLRDASGERLWYALSRNFRDNTSAQPINSDTRGTIRVFASDGKTELTTVLHRAVAVIFAPGEARGTQTRGAATQNTASNYLEISAGIDNAAAAGPYIVGRLRDPGHPLYNDRLIYLTTQELIPRVEIRVGQEIRALLEAYHANSECKCYPWADTWPASLGESDTGVNRGRFPIDPWPEKWGQGAIPDLPAWVSANKWFDLIYYSVARQNTHRPPPLFLSICDFCSANATLTVRDPLGDKQVSGVIFLPGTPRDSTWRVPPHPPADINDLSHYLEDARNRDGAGCPGPAKEMGNNRVFPPPVLPAPANCDEYETPTATTPDRDRLFLLTSPPADLPLLPARCSSMAAELLALAPCGQPPRLNPQCTTLAVGLAGCLACAAAAAAMIVTPCENTLKPPQCRAAITALKAC